MRTGTVGGAPVLEDTDVEVNRQDQLLLALIPEAVGKTDEKADLAIGDSSREVVEAPAGESEIRAIDDGQEHVGLIVIALSAKRRVRVLASRGRLSDFADGNRAIAHADGKSQSIDV